MASWLDTLAVELGQAPLSEREIDPLLNAARDIAHRVERKSTPLSTYLIGIAVGQAIAAGDDREAALQAALGRLITLLPPATAAPDAGGTAPAP